MKTTRPKPLFTFNFSLLTFLFSLFILSCSSPPSVPQWEYTGGPYAQNISTVHPDAYNASTVFVGMTNGELFVSTDQGNSWSWRSTIVPGKAIHTFVQHPEIPAYLYAGTAEGIFLTSDGGNRWKAIPIELGITPSCRTFAIDPFNTKIMYAGVDGRGLYTSTDGGNSWRLISLGVSEKDLAGTEFLKMIIDRTDPGIMYLATSNLGIFTTNNGGQTWTALTAQLAASGTITTHLLVHKRLPGHLCFGTMAGDVYKSTDGGTTWSPTRQGDGTNGIGGFALSAADPNLVYAGTETGVLVSSDFGTTWKDAAPDQPNVPCSIVGTSAEGQAIYAYGQGVGFRRSTDGGISWIKCETGLGSSSVSLLNSDTKNSKVFASVGKALYYYSQSAASWISVSGGLLGGNIAALVFDIDSNSTLYAGCTNGIYTTTNAGLAWQPLPKTLGPNPVKFFDTHATIRTRMFAATSAGLSYSTDRGNTWNPTKPYGSAYDVRSLTYSPNNSGIVHAALRDKASVGSTDGGITWASHRYGIKSEDVLAITSSDTDNKILYAWTANGDGFRSVNQGIEWDRYTPPWLIGDNVLLWADKKHSNNVVALVNKKHLHYSENGGGTWKTLHLDELKQDVQCILWSKTENALYAGTRGQGVFRVRVGKAFSYEPEMD